MHRQRFFSAVRWLALIVALTMSPHPSWGQSTEEVYAPGLKDFPVDFKLPDIKKCQDECAVWLRALTRDRDKLAAFDKAHPEFKGWFGADATAKAKQANFKSAQDAQSTAQTALTAAKKAKAVTNDIQGAFDTAKGNATEAKKQKDAADTKLKEADDKLPKGNKSALKDELAGILKNIQDDISKLKDCLDKCGAKIEPKVADGPAAGDGPGQVEDAGLVYKRPPKMPAGCSREQLNQLKIIIRKELLLDKHPFEQEWRDLLKQVNAAIDALGYNCPGPMQPGFPGTQTYPVSFPGNMTFATFAADGGRWCSTRTARWCRCRSTLPTMGAIRSPIRGRSIRWAPETPPPGKTPDDPISVSRKPDDPPAGRKPDDPPPLKTVEGTPPPPTKPDDPPPGKKPDEPPPLKTVEGTPPPPPPKTPEEPPPGTTPEEPPLIPDTVFVKAKESVLQGAPSGNAVPGQTVKLLPAEKPDLPGSGQTRTAQDTGFDRPPAQCTTGADGTCKMDVPPQDRSHYGLASRAGQAKQNYRVDVDMRKTTGAVIETTGRSKPEFPAGALGIAIRGDDLKVGNRTFTRVQSASIPGTDFSPREHFSKPGSAYEEDICRDKQPGPLALSTEPTVAPGLDLPQMTIRLRRADGDRKR